MDVLTLLIREILPLQWIALAVLSLVGFFVWYQVKKISATPRPQRRTRRTRSEQFQFAYAAMPVPEPEEHPAPQTMRMQTHRIAETPPPDDDGDDEEPNITKTTSLGAELSAKKFGLLAFVACAILRYAVQLHFPELWITNAWQFHRSMAVVIGMFWIYGMLRKNKRSWADVVVTILFVVWALSLFLVKGDLL